MSKPSIVFFGSFQHYSAKVLRALVDSKAADILAVITTPGENPTHTYAKSLGLPVFTPEKLDNILPTHLHKKYISRPDFFIVAGYGKLLPPEWLKTPKIACLNLHFSLLPKYRGANPAEWAILTGESKTGVTLIKMDSGIDTGPILMQEKISISSSDTRETLYEKLYDLAGQVIVDFLGQLKIGKLEIGNSRTQPRQSPTPYARRLTRADGFILWETIVSAMQTGHQADVIERKTRAISGYPGVWTKIQTVKGEKRLKILSCQLVNSQLSIVNCQLEGLRPSTFNQIKNQLV